MKKKVLLPAVLSTSMILGLVGTAYAAPDQGIYLGGSVDKYYTFSQFIDSDSKATEINNAGFENSMLYQAGKIASARDIVNAGGLTPAQVDYAPGMLEESYTSVDGTTYEPEPVVVDELKVKSVSAITTTGVDVVFDTITEAKEGFTIVVKDPSGNVIPVQPVNLEVGDTEITFTFEDALDEVALGNWTVDGKTFDATAQDAVQDVLAATTEVQLLNALKSSYFTGVVDANITAYDVAITAAAADIQTVADVQTVINEVNADQATVVDEATAVEAVNDATNQVELLAALQSSVFERVNSEWIVDYKTAIDAAAADTKDEVDEIQGLVDGVNIANVAIAIADATDELTASKIATAKSLVNAYIADDVAPATTKADLLEGLDLHNAVINVTLADTNAKLNNALTALAGLTASVDMDTVNSLELTRYRTAIDAAAVGAKDTAAKIQTLITNANTAAETAAVAAVAAVTAQTTTDELKTLLETLSNRSSFVADAFDADTIIDELLVNYRTDIVAAAAGAKDSAAEIQTIVDNANDPAGAVTALDAAAAGIDGAALLAALQALTLDLDNVIVANSAQYLADKAAIANAADDTAVPISTSVTAIQNTVNASNAVVELNDASTANDVKTILTDFAIATDNQTYINLSSTAKLEVAELILVDKTDNGDYPTAAALTAAITAQNTARTALITAVNNAGPDNTNTIVAIDAALEGIEYEAYDNLTAATQLEVAEKFLADFPMAGDPAAQVDYTTITAIKAAIDAAIAAN